MKIAKWLTRKVTGRHEALSRAQADRFTRLPKEQAKRELAAWLFDLAVRHATEFVKDDLLRPESPFRGVPATAVFHEMLALAFWIMDKEIAGGKKALITELHDLYFRAYRADGVAPQERSRALEEKYKRYESEWDDVTGHQDEFGLCVAQHIFGTEPSNRTRERTFWIIRYAHEIQNDLTPVKKTYRSKFKTDAARPASG